MRSDVERAQAIAYRRAATRALPFSLLVPVGLGVVLVAAGVALQPVALAIGAVGWVLAYLARAPVVFLLRRRGDEQLQSPWLVVASGPAEELVRLVVVLVLGRDLDTALSIGLGWAAIEVLYTGVQGLALATLMERDDPEAERVRALMPEPPAALRAANAPWWGVLERVWASVLHIAFTVVIAAQPILVLLTIVVHSATNLVVVRAMERWPLPRMELAGAAWSALVALGATLIWVASAA